MVSKGSREKKIRLEARGCPYPIRLMLFSLHNKTVSIIYINYDLENDVFSLHEKIRILISKYDPDYYVVVSEAWAPKNKEHVDYHRGDIAKLPSHEKTEMLTFIGKFKNSIDHRSGDLIQKDCYVFVSNVTIYSYYLLQIKSV